MKGEFKTYGEECCPPIEGTISILEFSHEDCQAVAKLADFDGLVNWMCKGLSCPSGANLYKYLWDARDKILEADRGHGCRVTFDDKILPEPENSLTVESL